MAAATRDIAQIETLAFEEVFVQGLLKVVIYGYAGVIGINGLILVALLVKFRRSRKT